ncbi:MAG: Rv3235 family protein [Actinomycetota bacterium]|nr:Rv3235 family protein [Actinomycetota bacterium]
MTTALATAQNRPTAAKSTRGIALVAVPDTEPPFDDELSAASRVRTLRSSVARVPAVSAPVGALQAASSKAAALVASPTVPDLSHAADIGVRHTSTDRLPAVRQTATTLARALTEVLTGARPVNQLQNHCTPPIFAALVNRAPLPGQGLARLQSAHVYQPADGVAEVAAVFRRGPRGRALAFRLTGLDGRWRITALQVG